QLLDAGISSDKVTAWDFPASTSPHERLPKPHATDRRVIYVGALSRAKGVSDLIEAAAILDRMAKPIFVDLSGGGDIEQLSQLSRSKGLGDKVQFKGLIENSKIIQAMADADVVVVPSRHEYSEGLPLTIYEALCSR